MKKHNVGSLSAFAIPALLLFSVACTTDNYKRRYILAEKLWADGKYESAVTEFEKVIEKDLSGKYGRQALFRAAMTQSLFLNKHQEAIEKFQKYIQTAEDPEMRWQARKEIGEILFERLAKYARAADHYDLMLEERPRSADAPMMLFRVAKSKFFVWKFDEAAELYQRIFKVHRDTEWAERALFEIGVTHFTGGEQQPGGAGPELESYRRAIQAYEKFIETYPKSARRAQALFGIAACYEELNELEEAQQRFEALRDSYPAPGVIQVKLARIQDRITQKNR